MAFLTGASSGLECERWELRVALPNPTIKCQPNERKMTMNALTVSLRLYVHTTEDRIDVLVVVDLPDIILGAFLDALLVLVDVLNELEEGCRAMEIGRKVRRGSDDRGAVLGQEGVAAGWKMLDLRISHEKKTTYPESLATTLTVTCPSHMVSTYTSRMSC